MSDESNEIGNGYMTNAYFKIILKSKYLSWHLMPLQVRLQENFQGFDLIILPYILYVFGQTGLSKQYRPR